MDLFSGFLPHDADYTITHLGRWALHELWPPEADQEPPEQDPER